MTTRKEFLGQAIFVPFALKSIINRVVASQIPVEPVLEAPYQWTMKVITTDSLGKVKSVDIIKGHVVDNGRDFVIEFPFDTPRSIESGDVMESQVNMGPFFDDRLKPPSEQWFGLSSTQRPRWVMSDESYEISAWNLSIEDDGI